MSWKATIKRLPGFRRLAGLVLRRPVAPEGYRDLCGLSDEELLSLVSYDSHRIEKGFYNDLLRIKPDLFRERKNRLEKIFRILEARGVKDEGPLFQWSRAICSAFPDLGNGFVRPRSSPAPEFDPAAGEAFLQFLRGRRSVRVWADEQPPPARLREVALLMIDAARWAPNSCNRQTWRFRILERAEEKSLLKKLKEEHCTRAPLLIFVGIDTRLYGGMGKEERSIHIDAGAAITQMILVAHSSGLGACWNHLGDDLISSRKVNREIYARFAAVIGIPRHIIPVAVVALGRPAFIPPAPPRIERARVMIGGREAR